MKTLSTFLIASCIFSCEKEKESNAILVKPKIQHSENASLVYPLRSFDEAHRIEFRRLNQKWLVAGVKQFESFKARPYYCPAGVKTIGYGHTGKHVSLDKISEEFGEQLLIAELRKFEKIVERNVKVPLDENQKAALTSFTYNTGEGNLRKLVNGKGRLNDGNYDSVPEIMSRYDKARVKGKVVKLRGLTKRRNWEIAQWNNEI